MRISKHDVSDAYLYRLFKGEADIAQNTVPTVVTKSTSHTYYTAENTPNKLKGLYARVLIKNKHPENSKQNAGLKPA